MICMKRIRSLQVKNFSSLSLSLCLDRWDEWDGERKTEEGEEWNIIPDRRTATGEREEESLQFLAYREIEGRERKK